jgi:Icc-related predicted phosphoesterase
VRVHVVSDVHGSVEALAHAADGADALVCLGDLVLFLDYDDHRHGIFADLFGAPAAAKLIELRSARRFAAARDFSAGLWEGLHTDRGTAIEGAIRKQYAALFAAMPDPTYLTYGNVDLPQLWPDYTDGRHHVLDGEVTEIGGRTFGFVGGGLRTPMRTPYEIDDDVYAAKVADVGEVDVLCCHIPPDVPEVLYDTRGRRMERGSVAVRDAVYRTQPQLMLHGHVHNPLSRRTRLGRTECVNVGHFRGTGQPCVLEWQSE